MEKKVTINEILDAISEFSAATDKRFTKIESEMVTKDYLDEKMSDLQGDLTILTRKEDKKVKKLVEILKKRKLISNKEVKEIMAMEPFPQLVL